MKVLIEISRYSDLEVIWERIVWYLMIFLYVYENVHIYINFLVVVIFRRIVLNKERIDFIVGVCIKLKLYYEGRKVRLFLVC